MADYGIVDLDWIRDTVLTDIVNSPRRQQERRHVERILEQALSTANSSPNLNRKGSGLATRVMNDIEYPP